MASKIVFEGLVSEVELAEELNLSIRTLRRWRKRREGPPYVRIGRQVYYFTEQARAWVRARVQLPRNAEPREPQRKTIGCEHDGTPPPFLNFVLAEVAWRWGSKGQASAM